MNAPSDLRQRVHSAKSLGAGVSPVKGAMPLKHIGRAQDLMTLLCFYDVSVLGAQHTWRLARKLQIRGMRRPLMISVCSFCGCNVFML